MNHFQESILESMHKHSFSNIISKLFLNCHCIWLRSYVVLSSSVWLFTYLTILFLGWPLTFCFEHYTLNQASPIPRFESFFQCKCHQVVDLTRIHLLHLCSWGEHTTKHDAIQDFFVSIVWDVGFHVLCMFFRHHLSSHHNDEWILCLQQMILTRW